MTYIQVPPSNRIQLFITKSVRTLLIPNLQHIPTPCEKKSWCILCRKRKTRVPTKVRMTWYCYPVSILSLSLPASLSAQTSKNMLHSMTIGAYCGTETCCRCHVQTRISAWTLCGRFISQNRCTCQFERFSGQRGHRSDVLG